ncbi:MAG: hypothetical protein JRI25_28580 [Deltaproteobacteria bacterium]|nr:hypothetical protein [Deltaproteobacteria bacterium]
MTTNRTLALGLLGVLATTAWAAPADRLPQPRPEPCIPFEVDPEEGEMLTPNGLSYAQVKTALNGVIQTALHCGQPDGMSAVYLTFDLTVGCDGVISEIETVDGGGAPADYVQCISEVIAKADFPAHDQEGGMMVTYPVNVSW